MSLDLLDWRRSTIELYRAVRTDAPDDPAGALARFRAGRDRLFAGHPESPLPVADRAGFEGLAYWPYDRALRFDVAVEPMAPERLAATSLGGDAYPLLRIGRVELPFGALEVYWIDTYGGGVFLPFRDATAGQTTYGAGRYLLDTVKGADLGGESGRLIVDFNYAYHPSCAYDPRWSCPLAPRANWLVVEVNAGERLRVG
jgi:uncharacterized protein (DUF1684 family)